MITEKVHNGIRYTLSNDNLRESDKVYPIAFGRVLDDGKWIFHEFDFRDFLSGFPENPHTIVNLKHSDYRPYEVQTDHGFSPRESYYRVIKKEIKDGSEWKVISEEPSRNKNVKLTLPAFDKWQDVIDLCPDGIVTSINFLQRNYPNGIKVGNIKYKTE